MLMKGSCYGSVKAQTLGPIRVWPDPVRNGRRNVVVLNSSLPRSSSSDLAAPLSSHSKGEASRLSAVQKPASLADRLRLGSLSDDGVAYKESFIVRSYEVGINKTATIETIANLLQEVGCNHCQSLGFSTDGFATTPTMRDLHLIWVTARMHIEIYKYPAWSDIVEIETWCQAAGRIGTRRDFILRDYANRQVIGRATSKWVMMNQDTRRLERVSNEIHKEYSVFLPKELRLAFPEEGEKNKSVKKIVKLEDPAQYSKLGLVPRRADLDMNQHVNNVTYIGWLLESIPLEIIKSHEVGSITLDYRRECQQGDVVDSLTTKQPISNFNGSNCEQDEDGSSEFLHLVRLSANGEEINRGRTEWRRKKLIR